MTGVRAILLDSSVLLSSDCDDLHGATAVHPAANYVLSKLRYSNIDVGISHELSLSSTEEGILQDMARTYSCNMFCLSSNNDTLSEVAQIWDDKGGSVVHVVSSHKYDLYHKDNGSGWLKVIVGSIGKKSSSDTEGIAKGISNMFIDQLEELLLLICQLNKKAMGDDVLTVGYVMKPSREEDFAKRGAFPMCPTQNGLIFLPLNYDLPFSSQLELVDAVLHKATDDILSVDMGSTSEYSDKVIFTKNLQELQRHVKCYVDCCVIDPFRNIFPVLDRLKILEILSGLENLSLQGHCKIRAPHFFKVGSFNEPNLEQSLVQAKLSLPTIVKSQVACGVSEAHSMAIVFEVDHYKDLSVPLPAVVQEFVDHSALIYKFYALGGKIFYAVKKSIPNAVALRSFFVESRLKPLQFDSLKSLPVAEEPLNANNHQIDLELVNRAADWLRRMLDLTIFGFDVVVQEGTGDHVIVDVNYLPSFKEVPDDVAIPAFWDALKEKIVAEKRKHS